MTVGAPTYDTLGATGKGLELEPVTHPNDLYTGENITFRFTIDGEAAANATLVLVKDGERYRDQTNALQLTTDKKGEVSFSVNEAGMYWLEAQYQDDNGKAPATQRQGSYVAVLNFTVVIAPGLGLTLTTLPYQHPCQTRWRRWLHRNTYDEWCRRHWG